MLCSPARAALITGLHNCHEAPFEITNGASYEKISTGEASHEEIEKAINSSLTAVPENQLF
ncbi:hypothetical protein GCM10028791_18510 [Echinicola sediminis]